MEKNNILKCIEFFNKLKIEEVEVSSQDELANGQKVVEVWYSFGNIKFKTDKLYYKNVLYQDKVKNPENLPAYFGEDVFWLDLEWHDWPDAQGAKLNNTVIPEIARVDIEFQKFLLTIANDNKDGFEQLITWEGRSAQYSINLENNNHWHDIIKLIQAIIKSKGKEVDKEFFSRLVFEWDNEERTSLHPHFASNGSRAIISNLYKNIQSIQNEINMENIIQLLKYKKQVILQGPPGTGKTRQAKEIAKLMAMPDKIDLKILNDFIKKIKIGQIFKTVSDKAEFTIKDVFQDRLVYQRKSTEEFGNLFFNDIIKAYETQKWLNVKNGSDTYSAPVAKFIFDNFESENTKLIQFHPSFSYEDFIRGISVEVNDGLHEYITKNKILGDFALKANANYLESKKAPKQLSEEKWLEDEIKKYGEIVESEIESNGSYTLNDNVSIFSVDDECFRYSGKNWDLKNRYRMKFMDIIQAKINNSQNRQDFKELRKRGIVSGRSRQHASYDLIVLNRFREYLGGRNAPEIDEPIKLKNFVLIIDEINRANLSSVLGELIYALEYRNQPVESMYEIDGDNKLTLPPNLFIIGTMNTADRSVGHIDYAIRRRFAFVDVLPSTQPLKELGKDYFKLVASLFIENLEDLDNLESTKMRRSKFLASDFKPEEVMIGHSYFIVKENDENDLAEEQQIKMKMKYEVLPILKEYIKDGILNDSDDLRKIISDLHDKVA